MRSMTGYGEKRFETPGLRARISVKTLNHRYFDWSYKGQPLGGLEARLKALAQKRLARGRVEAAVDLDFLDPAGWEVQINEGLLGKILETARTAAGRLGEDVRFSVDNLFRIPQIVELRHKALTAAERDFLATAFDRTLDYRKLNTAYQALKRGAKFFATNGDKTCPMPGGDIPDAGATLAALEHISGRAPDLLAGKPSTLILEVAMDWMNLPPERCIMIGDRLETDMRMGRQAGMLTAVTLTGVTGRDDVALMPDPPDYVIETLGDLLEM